MKALKLILIILTCLITLSLSGRISYADQIIIETDEYKIIETKTQDNDLFKYEFVIYNKLDMNTNRYIYSFLKIINLEENIFDENSTYTTASNWDYMFGNFSYDEQDNLIPAFIEWHAITFNPLFPTDEIPPQGYLNGFSFVSSVNIDFSAQEFVVDFWEFTTPIPEPATILLIGSGLAGVGLLKRKKRNI